MGSQHTCVDTGSSCAVNLSAAGVTLEWIVTVIAMFKDWNVGTLTPDNGHIELYSCVHSARLMLAMVVIVDILGEHLFP